MKRKMLGIAVAAAAGLLSTAAFAVQPFGNNSQKGSLLIFPDIRAGACGATGASIPAGSTCDTIIKITNDAGASAVRLKCYYEVSDPIPTPFTGTAATARSFKHFYDFTVDLTHNQPVAWLASTGAAVSASQRFSGVPAGFGTFPDGTATYTGGGLKCWAITDAGDGERAHNHLFGTASILVTGGPAVGQAYEYAAWTFQSLVNGGAAGASTPNPTPGVLNLDGLEYDPCPAMLVGSFFVPTASNTRIVLASCWQDLRQAYTPTITKLTYTFWNQDEQALTATHQCADSWYETFFPTGANAFNQINTSNLRTTNMYFQIASTADTQICGSSAQVASYVGVISESTAGGTPGVPTGGLPAGQFLRGTNLTGRGIQVGRILYDTFGGDVQKQ